MITVVLAERLGSSWEDMFKEQHVVNETAPAERRIQVRHSSKHDRRVLVYGDAERVFAGPERPRLAKLFAASRAALC
jgi:hypothetical protein